MKKILLNLLLFSPLSILAQSTDGNKSPFKIIGKIIDSSTGKPLEYATISLFTLNNTKPVNGTTSNIAGSFEITEVPEGTYNAVIESIGYQPVTINDIFVNNKNPVKNLRTTALLKKSKNLKAVEITVEEKLIENKIDKVVFNAEKDITSQTGVATDILKKIPQVSVDIDGNVELSGSSSIRFLINGKPSTTYGSNISDILQSLPAGQVKSVEVITNPGAKYDAEGLGGIINIILKSTTAEGTNGNLSVTAGTRLENLSFNLNERKERLGFNAFAIGNARLTANTSTNYQRSATNDFENTLTELNQEGDNHFKRHGIQTGIGFDWNPDEKNSLVYSISYNNFGNSGNGIINQSQVIKQLPTQNIISDTLILNNIDNKSNYNNVEMNLNYKKIFSNKDHELDFLISSGFGKDVGTANSNQLLLPADSVIYGSMSRNPGNEKETEIQVDYSQPLKNNIILGIGSKLSTRDITNSSNVLSFETSNKKYLPDTFLSNVLGYHQKVFAIYSEINFPVSTLFEAKIGGRYERTDINSYFSNAQNQADIPGYNTFVPSVFFIKKLSEDQSIKLSYSKRIERPEYTDLNPFINTTDPKNLTSGNPYLQPEIGSRYEISYNATFNKLGSFTASFFYRTSNHDIQPYIIFYPLIVIGDTEYTNVSINTSNNIGLEKNTGINLFSDLHFFTKLNVRTNLFFFKRHTINNIDEGRNSSSNNYRINVNVTYQFLSSLSGEFYGNFNSTRNELQGKYPSYTFYSLAIRKQFSKKTSLAITASNPFNKYINQKTYLYGSNFTTTIIRKVPFRSFGINFAWKFGKLEFKKPNAENSDNLNGTNE